MPASTFSCEREDELEESELELSTLEEVSLELASLDELLLETSELELLSLVVEELTLLEEVGELVVFELELTELWLDPGIITLLLEDVVSDEDVATLEFPLLDAGVLEPPPSDELVPLELTFCELSLEPTDETVVLLEDDELPGFC